MTQELHYTSAPRGLKPGSVGFCTVAQTANLPGPLAERLEALSGYQQVFPPHDPNAALNPVAFSHLRIAVGGRACSVLSRVGFAGLDYSARSNKYAHHIVLDAAEQPAGGPAWLLAQPGFLQSSWQGEPRILSAGRTVPVGDRPPTIALAWGAQTGDPGWAGVLAESFLADPRKPSYLLFEPGMDVLPLFVEALALVPPERRWEVELSTYFTQLLQGTSCPWRGVLADSAEAKNAHRMPGALVIDLRRPPGEARGGDLVQLARTGRLPARKVKQVSPVPEAPSLPPSHRPSRAQIPTASEAEYSLSASPPKPPPARNVRELEGFEDERPGLPWGKISAGVAAMLLIALGAGIWFRTFDGLYASIREKLSSRELIAKASREISRKAEKVAAEKKQAEKPEQSGRDSVAKRKEEEEPKLAKTEGKAKPAQTPEAAKPHPEPAPPLADAGPKPNPVKQDQSMNPPEGNTDPLPKAVDLPSAEQTVWFRELPAVGGSLIQSDAPAKDMTINFDQRIGPPIEVLQRKIATNRNSRKETPAGDVSDNEARKKTKAENNSELDQLINAEQNELNILIPSKALFADAENIATISIDERRLTFRWDGHGASRSRRSDLTQNTVITGPRQLADLVRDAAIEFNLNGKGTRHLLMRDPKPRTERVSLKAGAWTESSKSKWIDIQWVEDAKNLADCEWDLVVTDWRIVSALKGKDLVTFASVKSKDPNNELKQTILEEGLSFGLLITKDRLTARFRFDDDLSKKMDDLKTQQKDSMTKLEALAKEISKLQKSIADEKNEDERKSLQQRLKELTDLQKNDEHEYEKRRMKLSLYNHYQHPDRAFLDVGIGLRLSNGKVIEIARLGPRW